MATTVTLRIAADGTAAITEIKGVGEAIRKIGDDGRRGGAAASDGLARTGEQAKRTRSEVDSLRESARNLIATWLSIRGVGALISMADEAANLSAKINITAKSQQEFNLAQEETFRISQRTSSALGSTVTLYSRLAASLGEAGVEQSKILRLTETINQAFVVSGATAQESAAATIQLSQAFASGTLRGEEFNSVNEQAPRIMQALAKSLGVTRGELRAMAEEGKLTSEALLEALSGNQAALIAAEFAKVPLTVGRAFVQLRNEALKWVGEADKASGASRTLAESIVFLSKHIDTIATLIGVIVGLIGLRLVAALHASTVAWLAKQAAVLSSAATLATANVAIGATATVAGTSAVALGGMAVAARTLAAALGPLAILASVVVWLTQLVEVEDHVSEAATRSAEAIQKAAQASYDSEPARFAAIASARQLAAAELEAAEAALELAQINVSEKGFLVSEADVQELSNAAAEVDQLRKVVQDADNTFGAAAVGGIQDWIASILDANNAMASANYDDAVNGLTTMVNGLEEQRIKLTQGTEASLRYRIETELGVQAGAELGKELEGLITRAGSLTKTVDTLTASKRVNREAARETAQAEREAAQAQRELEQATLAAENAYRSYVQQFEPMLALELEHADALKQIEKWHTQGAISIQRYGQMKAQAVRANAQAVAELTRERDILGRLNREHAQQVAMLGMSRRELAGYQASIRAAAQAQSILGGELERTPGLLEEIKDTARENEEALFDMEESANSLQEILSRFDDIGFSGLVGEIALVEEALAKATKKGGDGIDEMKLALGQLTTQMQIKTVGSFEALLGAAQEFTDQGSRGFDAMQVGMAALSIVQDILALKAGVTAVLTQGQGEPYSAFARMAAMAAAVAPFLASIGVTLSSLGGGGGGFTDTAAQRQATQGTGTVLGDSEAKSESILNAVEITADATSALVGINRGMLRALIQLQDSIGSATGMLARGAGDIEFDQLNIQPMQHAFLGSIFTPMLRFLSGSSQVTDTGILIGGGGLGDLNARAYQEEQYRSWRFGSRRTREQTGDLPDSLATQFQLIIDSIVETVREGALALGVLPAEIEAALESFRIEEIRISTMDLSAEEQQAELLAVFSSIFDGLAGDVVPWIEQFQQVGEGLGETLVRVATGVQVMQQAIEQLGFSLSAKPEQFAQASEALIGLMGGIEEFIGGMTSFVSAFATDEHRFRVATDALTSAFAEVGLTVPTTRDEMWALMQSLDATTEEGREQIATLLRLAGVADEYYSMLERGGAALIDQLTELGPILGIVDQALDAAANGGVVDWASAMEDLEERNQRLIDTAIEQGATEEQLDRIRRFATMRLEELAAAEAAALAEYDEFIASFAQVSPFQATMAQIRQQEAAAIRQANTLARAAGMQGAAERDLAQIHRWAAGQIAAAIAELRARTLELVDELGYSGLNTIEARIRELESAGSSGGGGDGLVDQIGDLYEAHRRGIQSVRDYLDSMLLGDLTALTPEQRLAEARRQLEVTAAAARGGDAEAMARLPQMSDVFLRLLREFDASGDDYNAGFQWVRDLLGPIAGMEFRPPPGGSSGSGGTVGPSPELIALYEQRDALLAEQEALHRQQLALQLVQHLADLSQAINTPVLELMETMGVPIRQLAIDLGANLEEISGATVQILADMARQLGIPLGELVEALDLELPDLAAGIRELAEGLGIDLAAMANDVGGAMLDFARLLGIDLQDLAVSLGIDLGRLTDANSPIFLALQGALDDLSPDIRDELDPLLSAITNATNEADANRAIRDAEAAINLMPPGIRDALAPFFAGVFPSEAMSDLDYLEDIDSELNEVTRILGEIAENTRDLGQTATGGISSFAVGTSFVPRDMLAHIHRGEMVIDQASAAALRYGIQVQGTAADREDLRAIREELRRLGDKVEAAVHSNVEATRDTTKAVILESEKDRRLREDLARRAEPVARSTAYG